MAGIGLYGVYYAKASLTSGVLTGYAGGVKTMGKAISASFEPADTRGDPLYANNGVAERDALLGSGGELTLTLDRLTQAAYGDLYGLTVKATTVMTSVGGSGFDFDGTESGNVVLFNPPSDEYQTLGETVEWQTPEITGTVGGAAVCGAKPWRKIYEFPTQAACEAFINAYFAA